MMPDFNNEIPMTTSQADEPHSTNDQEKHKKRSFLEDDFFSLSSSFDKKKRKHKHKSRDATPNSSDAPLQPIKIEGALPSKQVPNSCEANTANQIKLDFVPIPEANSIPTTTTVTRGVMAPPIIDKEQILREIEQKVNEREAKSSTPVFDVSDEEVLELEIVKSSPKTKPTKKSSAEDHGYKFSEADEKKRRYIIKITSKLPAPVDATVEVDLGCKGMKSFSKIIKYAVDFYKSTYSSQLPPILLDRYDVELCSLVWVEGKMIVNSFYTPRTLRIAPPGGEFNALVDKVETMPPTTLHFFLIPKDNSENFMNVYPELRASVIEPEIKETEETTIAEELSQSSSEDEEDDMDEPNSKEDELVDLANDEEGVFSIGLKGKDNKRISCKVTPQTKIERLLKFYLKKKGIDESSINLPSVKMIFDDEELDLNDIVANTELEDDFEIQIII